MSADGERVKVSASAIKADDQSRGVSEYRQKLFKEELCVPLALQLSSPLELVLESCARHQECCASQN